KHLDIILRKTTAVLSTEPGLKWEFKQELLKNIERAKQVGDNDTEDFQRGVFQLVDEGVAAVGTITPRIPAVYREVWNLLVQQVRTSMRRIDDDNLYKILANVTD